MTTLFGGSESGAILRLMILYQAKMFQSSRFENLDLECLITPHDWGIMDPDHLTDYIEKVVLPFLKPDAKVNTSQNRN
jgi:hypothetical protein